MLLLPICNEKLRWKIIRSANDSTILSHITYSYCCASPNITYFEVKWIFFEYQNIWRFDITMGQLYFLQMSKRIEHWSHKYKNFILRKKFHFLFSVLQKLFQIGDPFFHLDVAFFIFELIFLYKTVTALILYKIRMRVQFKFTKQLNLLPENKFTHVIFQTNFFDTFNIALIIFYFIHITIAFANHSFPLDDKLFI